MDNVKWIVQNNLIQEEENHVRLIALLKKHNIDFQLIDVIPFADLDTLDNASNKRLIPYGSANFIQKVLNDSQNWHVFHNEFFHPVAVAINRKDAINRVRDSPVHRIYGWLQNRDKDRLYFIKSCDGFKTIPGQVLSAKDILALLDVFHLNALISLNTPLIVSEYQQLDEELRAVIVDRKLISCCMYRNIRNKLLPVPRQVNPESLHWKLIEDMAKGWLPHDTCIMDVTIQQDVKTDKTIGKVIEFNCFNCSGFYAIDIEPVILAVTRRVSESNA